MPWIVTHKFDPRCAKLADGHYSRRTVGSPQFMPPGETLILVTEAADACWGWWRPHPRSGIVAMNGLDGWTCTLFRNTGPIPSSELVLEAEAILRDSGRGCGPSGLLTYVFDAKVRSTNPGWCYKVAGWLQHPTKPRSADNRKTLIWKPWHLAGVAVCPWPRPLAP